MTYRLMKGLQVSRAERFATVPLEAVLHPKRYAADGDGATGDGAAGGKGDEDTPKERTDEESPAPS